MASTSANPEALSVEYNRLRASTHALLADTGDLLGSLVAAPAADGDHQQIDIQLSRFWGLFEGLRKRHDEAQLSVAVLALTKSGKSTLLNAFIGDECLPVNNVPETARICRITHVPGAPQPIMTVGPGDSVGEHVGAAAIRDCLQRFNQQVREHERHGPADERLLEIRAHVAGLGLATDAAAASAAQQGEQGTDSAPTRLSLLDTPGPNEAGEEGLRFQVERLLDSVDAVVYLLDYSKLKTAEEASVLRRLKAINPALLERLCCRLFFVVNKMDQAAESQGLDEEETRQYVAGLITRQLDCAGFTLHPDQVLLLSARDALTARLVLTGRADADTFTRFSRIAFGAFARRKTPAPKLGDEAVRTAAAEMLECSGILELEERVLSFLYAHSAGLKLLATMDDVGRLLQEVSNVVTACRGALERDADALVERTEALREELMATLGDFDGVMDVTSALREEVTDELRGHLANLRSRLFTLICNALETDNITAHLAGTSAAAVGAQGSRWARVRARFVAMFAAGPSKDALSSALIDLHEDLVEQIHAEVGEFWHVMESCTSARHAGLVAAINAQLERLSARVEGAVAEQLQVRLEPVDVRLDMPSAEQFHVNLTDLIEKGIGEQQERHIRTGQRMEWVTQRYGGICKWGHYYERRVPRMRTVVETYTTTTYTLRADAIREHFIQVVDTAISTTERALAGYVREYIRLQVEAARMAIDDYGNGYLSTMNAALDTSLQGQEHRLSALAQVEGYCTRVTELRGRVSELQAAAELLVPHNSPAGLFEQVVYEDEEEAGEEGEEDYAAAAASTSAAASTAGIGLSTSADAAASGVPTSGTQPAAAAHKTLQAVEMFAGPAGVAAARELSAGAAPAAAARVPAALAANEDDEEMPGLRSSSECGSDECGLMDLDSGSEGPPGLIESEEPPGLLTSPGASSSSDTDSVSEAAPGLLASGNAAWWQAATKDDDAVAAWRSALHEGAAAGAAAGGARAAADDDSSSCTSMAPTELCEPYAEAAATGESSGLAAEQQEGIAAAGGYDTADGASRGCVSPASTVLLEQAPGSELDRELEALSQLMQQPLAPEQGQGPAEAVVLEPAAQGAAGNAATAAGVAAAAATVMAARKAFLYERLITYEEEQNARWAQGSPELMFGGAASQPSLPSLGSSCSEMELLSADELDAARAAEAASAGELLMQALPTGAAAPAAADPQAEVVIAAAPEADTAGGVMGAAVPEVVQQQGAVAAVGVQQEAVTSHLVERAASLVVDVENQIKTLQQRLEAAQLEDVEVQEQQKQEAEQQSPGRWMLDLGSIAGAQQLSLGSPDVSPQTLTHTQQEQAGLLLDLGGFAGVQQQQQQQEQHEYEGQQEEGTDALLLGPDELGQLMSTLEGEAAMSGSAHQDHLPYSAAAMPGTASPPPAVAAVAAAPGASLGTSVASLLSLAGSSVAGLHASVPVSHGASGHSHSGSGGSYHGSESFASIVAHSDAGSVHAELRSSLAMALSAAGLGDLPTPPNGSPTDSDEWQLVGQEGEEEAHAA